MKKNVRLLLLITGLLFTLFLAWIFFPSSEPLSPEPILEVEAPFLKTDPQWTDSLLAIMSTEEKIAQLFIPRINRSISLDTTSVRASLKTNGFCFEQAPEKKEIDWMRHFYADSSLFFFFSTTNTLSPFPNTYNVSDFQLLAIRDTQLLTNFCDNYIRESKRIGLNLLRGFDFQNKDFTSASTKTKSDFVLPYIQKSNAEHLLYSGLRLYRSYDRQLDSLYSKDGTLDFMKTLCDSGMTCLIVDSTYFEWKTSSLNHPTVIDFCEDILDFRGLIATDIPRTNPTTFENYWKEGVDLYYVGTNFSELFKQAKTVFESGKISINELDKRVRKILLAKSWIRELNYPGNFIMSQRYFNNSPFLKSISKHLAQASLICLKNNNAVLPFHLDTARAPLVIEIGNRNHSFQAESKYYCESLKTLHYKNSKASAVFKSEQANRNPIVIVSFNNIRIDSSSKAFIQQLLKLDKSKKVIIVNYAELSNLSFLKEFNCVLHVPNASEHYGTLLAKSVFSAQRISARLPIAAFSFNAKDGKTIAACRLNYGEPEDVGLARDSLYKIDYIMQEGISNRAFPGGEVLLALQGTVFYHKFFGNTDYENHVAVNDKTIYDMASVTKVAATTLMAMKLYEDGAYQLDDSLYKHLPDTLKKFLTRESSIKNITFRELLKHGSGLPAGQNIIRFLRFPEPASRYDTYYCNESNKQFSIALSDSFYIDNDCLDTLWLDLNKIYVDPNKSYCYSDANMNLLYTMLNSKLKKQKWTRVLDSLFYRNLGMRQTLFLPLRNGVAKEHIAPTEKDNYWRKCVLQGYVHDPTAALYGGVAGNAGLFSNAKDMAVLCQLFLNKGYYGGYRYFKSKTVDLFTAKQEGTHRGLGFNGQISGSTYGCSPFASNQTYGHTGFTGTAFWIDPKIEFIYVFITNRVHPNPENKKIIQLGTTKRVHNVVYELLLQNNSELQVEL